MSIKSTRILEWILLGYGGVVVVVALVLAPLVIGLGDDGADSSPVRSLQSWSGLPFQSLASRRSRRSGHRWKARARLRRPRASRAAVAAPVVEACGAALDRLISCTQDEKVKNQLLKAKETFVSNCRGSSKETRKAERCTKRSTCKTFVSCLGGS